jgi:hypothetical protein
MLTRFLIIILYLALYSDLVFAADPDRTESLKLVPTEAIPGSSFGHSVDMREDLMVIGAPYDKPTNSARAGSVYVYEARSYGWSEPKILTATVERTNDYFGTAVAIAGEQILASHIDNGSLLGAVHVFEFVSFDWEEVDMFRAADGQPSDGFGKTIAVDGNILVVGAPYDDLVNGSFSSEGAAYVFERTDSGWQEVAKLIGSDSHAQQGFGWSVAISGDTILIGAPLDTRDGARMGAAYVFEKPVDGWTSMTESQKLTPAIDMFAHEAGRSVAISGDTLVVSAPYSSYSDDIPPYYQNHLGAVYVFERSEADWQEVARLRANDSEGGERLGFDSVAVTDGAVLASARLFSPYYSDSAIGSAYLFEKPDAGWVSGTAPIMLGPALPEFNQNFATAVAMLYESLFLIGAGKTGLDAAYLFDSAPPVMVDIRWLPDGLVAKDSVLLVLATATDAAHGSDLIASAEYRLNAGEWLALDAEDGKFDESIEPVQVFVDTIGMSLGEHQICFRASDSSQTGLESCATFEISENVNSDELDLYCQHDPLLPQPEENVTINLQVYEPFVTGEIPQAKAVDQVEIWFGDNNEPAAVEAGAGAVDSLNYKSLRVYDDVMFYGCRAKVGSKSVFTGWRRVDIDPADTDGPIAVSVTGPSSERVDIVFIADVDSYTGSDDPDFLSDVEEFISTGYYKFSKYSQYQHLFNFWISRNTAEVGRENNTSDAERILVPPIDWEENYAFADAGAIIHTDSFRDFAKNGFFAISDGRNSTLRHESGHRPFGLADEYSGDVITYESSNLPNVYVSLENCEADAPNLGRIAADCRQFESDNDEHSFFTSEPVEDDLMNDNGTPNAADIRKIEYLFEKCQEGEC